MNNLNINFSTKHVYINIRDVKTNNTLLNISSLQINYKNMIKLSNILPTSLYLLNKLEQAGIDHLIINKTLKQTKKKRKVNKILNILNKSQLISTTI